MIRGATGDKAHTINGIFETTDEMSGGMPVYRKMGDSDTWLVYNPSFKAWFVQLTLHKGMSAGWAYLDCVAPSLPENITKCIWKVQGRVVANGHQTQVDVDISAITPEEVTSFIAAEAEALAASFRADGHKVYYCDYIEDCRNSLITYNFRFRQGSFEGLLVI